MLRLLPLVLLLGFVAPENPRQVTVKDLKFTPARMTVKAGETVTWKNADTRDYNVRAADGSFDSGNLAPGKSFSHAFPKPGTYPYASRIHPRMKGVVVVNR